MLIQLTVGKVDAGVAVLLTEDKRLIEFPSILLPPSITSGSIVDITVSQNHDAEIKSQSSFTELQNRIVRSYGLESPSAPTLRLRGATQTSLVLEWDPLRLATSRLKSLSLYRNGSKAGSIPRPKEMLSTKISGLAVDTEYSFHLVLRTTGGTYASPVLTCRTHKMTDLSGITVTPGVLAEPLRASLQTAVERIGGRIAETVRIDTTHFVCTEGRGKDWERAKDMNIPVVRPEWVEGCEREGRIVGVRGYYLDANPKQRQVGSNPQFGNNSAAAGSSSNVAVGPKSEHTSLPQRRPAEPLKSPDRDSHITGEGNGPGPEIAPTPPPKTERDRDGDRDALSAVSAEEPASRSPAADSSISEEEDDDREETGQEGDASGGRGERDVASERKEGSAVDQGKSVEASRKARVDNEADGEGSGNGEMDEVPL